MDYLWIIMDYHGLSMDYLWIIMDYHGLSWIIQVFLLKRRQMEDFPAVNIDIIGDIGWNKWLVLCYWFLWLVKWEARNGWTLSERQFLFYLHQIVIHIDCGELHHKGGCSCFVASDNTIIEATCVRSCKGCTRGWWWKTWNGCWFINKFGAPPKVCNISSKQHGQKREAILPSLILLHQWLSLQTSRFSICASAGSALPKNDVESSWPRGPSHQPWIEKTSSSRLTYGKTQHL